VADQSENAPASLSLRSESHTASLRAEARVLTRDRKPVSPWVQLETITAMMPGRSHPETYHALQQADYVNVLCLHEGGTIVLVQQFRPVLDIWTLEFPGGLRDGEEPPEDAATREVQEETGLSVRELVPLVQTFADVGRLTNRYFGFFALVQGEPRTEEAGLEPVLVPPRKLIGMAQVGELAIPGNVGLLYLAGLHPRVRAICRVQGEDEPPWMIP
jgi:ADP-ribose pyrophosphatase YjhB (NUDIX family)